MISLQISGSVTTILQYDPFHNDSGSALQMKDIGDMVLLRGYSFRVHSKTDYTKYSIISTISLDDGTTVNTPAGYVGNKVSLYVCDPPDNKK